MIEMTISSPAWKSMPNELGDQVDAVGQVAREDDLLDACRH